MSEVPFTKYTSFGNNFVIVDETRGPILSEMEKQTFAYHATNGCFGIGSDNFIVVQPCTRYTLLKINQSFGYWRKPPEPDNTDFIFRMLEPDGVEALSCGNGLMCIARHLFLFYGISESRILTEIPTSAPRPVQIGRDDGGDGYYAELGNPRRIPGELVRDLPRSPLDDVIETIEPLVINNLRRSDNVEFLGDHGSIRLEGYLIFTGEPHLVILADEGISPVDPVQFLFPGSVSGTDRPHYLEKRRSTGLAFINFIGNYLNSHLNPYFPKGINVNFVRRPYADQPILEYRCFERGIKKETLACGTGALACALVMAKIKGFHSNTITVRPHLCRLCQPQAQIKVKGGPGGWRIYGEPVLLVDGVFSPRQPKEAAVSHVPARQISLA